MGTRAAVAAGTVVSVGVTAVWSWTSVLTTGPVPPLHLGRNLPADYAHLADAATGSNGHALFAVTACIYTACFLVSGLRRRKRQRLSAENEPEQEPPADQNRPARRSVYR